MEATLQKLVTVTESFLTWRERRKWKRKQKQKQKNVVLDWVEAFIWSAFVVLLVNQYFFQAYEIPSSSMEDTLLVHDRIFVNKFLFGPELLPGLFKLPGPSIPARGDIIIFENPSYLSQGPIFDIAQRLIYMMTLSLVDIDREPDGSPKAHFLIKRAIGYGGDVVRFRNGEAQFLPAGTSTWLDESQMKKSTALQYTTKRERPDIRTDYYQLLPAAARATKNQELGLTVDPQDQAAVKKLQDLLAQAGDAGFHQDGFEFERQQLKYYLQLYPNDADSLSQFQRLDLGRYIARGWLLPLGDNRDNSRDGRYFGPVPLDKILGEASFRYWPLGRFGEIR